MLDDTDDPAWRRLDPGGWFAMPPVGRYLVTLDGANTIAVVDDAHVARLLTDGTARGPVRVAFVGRP